MAGISKRDRLTEEAQKLVLRGQVDKAIKIYEQILELDPSATSLRQKLAELLVKCGRNDEARKELENIGKAFAKNGFYLKSIAVYKQLQKLFPADISLSLELAELNERHGLAANAIAEYKLVYEFHKKASNHIESLRMLEKMQSIDQQNALITAKLAEAYIQAGKTKEAFTLLSKTASLLLDRGDNVTLAKICACARQLLPDRPAFLLEVISNQINKENSSACIEALQSMLRSNTHNKSAWDLVVRAYQLLEQPKRVKAAYQHYLKFFPTEPSAIIGYISSVAAEGNLAEALALFKRYDSNLSSAIATPQLEQLYQSLEKLDPVNTQVIEGLARFTAKTDNVTETTHLTARLQSIRNTSDEVLEKIAEPVPAPFVDAGLPPVLSESPIPSCFDLVVPGLTADSSNDEIEIEIDDYSQFDALYQPAGGTSTIENGLDAAVNLFDAISTNTGSVKFGNEMDSSDAQSHFDLGQAFKEMGLYDEAINEFRQASQDHARRVECLIMQCACLRERGEAEKAISMLLTLLKPELSNEESCAIKYELAAGYEATGRTDEANRFLNEISSANPDFRDISSRLNAVDLANSLEFSDDDLKDF